MKIRGPSKSAPPSNVLQHIYNYIKIKNIVKYLEKNCLCVAVMIFNTNLHVNNEYNDCLDMQIQSQNKLQ